MKWFKHLVDSGDDPDIDDAISLFGPAGYYVFFRTLEIMGREFDPENPGKNKFSVLYFKSKFRCNWSTTKKILNYFHEKHRIQFVFTNTEHMDQIELNCPKLRGLCDEYSKKQISKKSGQNQEFVGTKSGHYQEQETEEEEETDIKKHASGSFLIKEKIIEKCDQVARLPQKDKFNPYQFANAKIKDGYHPDIVFIALCGIQDSWDTISRPWGWGTSILKTKQQMYNEKKHTAESQKFKEMWSIDPRIKKLILDIGG